MDKKQQEFKAPMVGGSSLLVIFAVLCLTIFALLGFSTVQANKRLADVSAAAVSDYYAADHQAEQILAELRSGIIPEGVQCPEDGLYRYACPISDTQELQVELKISGNDWEVLRWQAVSTIQWNENDKLDVWDGKSGS